MYSINEVVLFANEYTLADKLKTESRDIKDLSSVVIPVGTEGRITDIIGTVLYVSTVYGTIRINSSDVISKDSITEPVLVSTKEQIAVLMDNGYQLCKVIPTDKIKDNFRKVELFGFGYSSILPVSSLLFVTKEEVYNLVLMRLIKVHLSLFKVNDYMELAKFGRVSFREVGDSMEITFTPTKEI